jgi:protein-S-isoprenylcysteine O-methyltransferase Ste14
MIENIAAGFWVLGIIAWCAIRYPHQRRARKLAITTHKRSLEEKLLLFGTFLGLVVLPATWLATGWPAGLDYEVHPLVHVAGIVCMCGFLTLFYCVHRQLGRNWSITLEIREEHKLVTEGLFRHVRHPMYSSFWLWAVAQTLLLPNWVAGFAGLASIAALYFRRVYREERMMQETFGNAYQDYMQRTKRIVPWLY